METVKETDIYEKADTGSSVLATLEQGQPVICCEVSGSDGWYEITYQGTKGYALRNASRLTIFLFISMSPRRYTAVQSDRRKSHFHTFSEAPQSESFWGGVMAVLIELMFAIGIFTVLRKMKKGNMDAQ